MGISVFQQHVPLRDHMCRLVGSVSAGGHRHSGGLDAGWWVNLDQSLWNNYTITSTISSCCSDDDCNNAVCALGPDPPLPGAGEWHPVNNSVPSSGAMYFSLLIWWRESLYCVSETPTLPPVQVFDKTMAVKQMHILEPQDLLITRADKGRVERKDWYCLVLPPCTSEVDFL